MAPTSSIPTRTDLGRPGVRMLQAGGPTKADLRILDSAEGPLVVKDFRHKAAWVRWIGRLQIARECKAYRRLGPRAGLPRFAGRVDAHALAIEWIDGEQLGWSERRHENGAAYLKQLREIVDGLHASGLVHLDLRGRDNVLLDADGNVKVVDLAGAVWFRPGSWAHRALFPWFRKPDAAALLKWKRVLGAGEYTEQERSFLRRYAFWRSLWIFNRK